MAKVTVSVDFTFDTDEYNYTIALNGEVKSDAEIAAEITEQFLHGDADMPEDHGVQDNGVHVWQSPDEY